MPTLLRGSTLELELIIEPVTPEGPVPTMADVLVDIINPSGVEVVTDAAATEDPDPDEEGVARWTYDFVAAEDAELGDWTIHWTFIENGNPGEESEVFSVVLTPSNPWISSTDAQALTGTELTDAQLMAAAQDIYDEMRWTPVYGTDFTNRPQAVSALGRAIAWHAAYLKATPATPTQKDSGVSSESIGNYSVSYGSKGKSVPMVADRALSLLRKHGLYRMTGYTHVGQLVDDEDRVIRVY